MARQPTISDHQVRRPLSAASGTRRPRSITGATTVFWLLFGINIVNYLDRFVAVAVGPTLKTQFHLHDRDVGLLSSAFLLVYTLTAIPMGLLADRVSRARVVSVGVALWSVASGATAFVRGYTGLFLSRVGVGIGEASYFPAGTALLSGYFPQQRRARVMSRWNAGQLVGIAAAFVLSGLCLRLFGEQFGWRLIFLFTALPGLLLALLMRRVAEAPGAPAEQPAQAHLHPSEPLQQRPVGLRANLRHEAGRMGQVLQLRTVWMVILLQALMFSVVTPMVTFLPIYAHSPAGPFKLTVSQTALLTGLAVVLGGLAGTVLGGNVSDWLGKRVRGGRVLAATVGYGLALPCFVVMLLTHTLLVFVAAATLVVFALSMPAGPLTASGQDVTPERLRATAVALILLLSHILGDVWSPGVVGAISTRMAERSAAALLIIGVPALALALVASVFGARFYAAEAPTGAAHSATAASRRAL
jgi:MFS family permease